MLQRLGDGGEVFYGAVEHLLVQTADGELGEVRRSAVKLDGSFVKILLVDDNSVSVAIDEVWDVGDAAGLAA